MAEMSIVFNDINKSQGVFTRRAFLMGGFVAFGLVALTGRLAHLQILQGSKYSKMSVGNQFNFRVIPPPRGDILDRNGKVIAGNRPSFRVMIETNEVKDIDTTLDQVSYILPQTITMRRRILRDINQNKRSVPTLIAGDLSWEDFSKVSLYAADIPGVVADMDQLRAYYHGGAFSHVVGYVSKINAADMKVQETRADADLNLLHHPSFRIGKQGIEKSFDNVLRGTAGGRKIEVDAGGKVVGEDGDGSIPPEPGTDVTLTLDLDIQNRALEAFGTDSGSAVMMNIHSGEVICMLSAPSFDPNLFVSGISSKAYRVLADYERKPLLDKSVGSTFAPGSTFKMATALAILDAGIDPEEQVFCRGGLQSGNRFFRCHGVHGAVNMRNAHKFSCDTYFYAMCNRAGVDRIAKFAGKLGLGHVFDSFEIGGQKKGLIPTEQWKREWFNGSTRARHLDPKWHPGETLSVAIGQGYVNVSPLQLAVFTARIANGMKAVEPHLVRKIGDQVIDHTKEYADLGIPKAHLDIVRGGMWAVSNEPGGTGRTNSQLDLGPNIQISGKTGTAQVRGYDKAGTRKAAEWKYKDHGLFVCFGPSDAPKYACAVVVQHGVAGGRFAAPKAREIMRLAMIKDPEIQKRITGPVNTALDKAALERGEVAGASDMPNEGLRAEAPPGD
ncbi:penicillin-binding protein 2 [Asticcacaulis sp. AC402]|uniref:penicillin-binding protein 2 n=1 Tax=Asticcacaulis sp. AC402 TaxID=1282361 RepID=UPI0003C3E369|nr:penicillin-binding protein 2 [Asticcacaulis sp. AC402]ESQ75601.1 penicillin-binding protein 2 [Asticcacaulis sp. AC402]